MMNNELDFIDMPSLGPNRLDYSTGDNILEKYEKKYLLCYTLVGSALFLTNPKDIDIIALVKKDRTLNDLREEVFAEGYKDCAKQEYNINGENLLIVRKGSFNLIFTTDPMYYATFVISSHSCKTLSLIDKSDRIKIHEFLRAEIPKVLGELKEHLIL